MFCLRTFFFSFWTISLLSLPGKCRITALLLIDLLNLKAPKPFFSSTLQKVQHSQLKTVHCHFFLECMWVLSSILGLSLAQTLKGLKYTLVHPELEVHSVKHNSIPPFSSISEISRGPGGWRQGLILQSWWMQISLWYIRFSPWLRSQESFHACGLLCWWHLYLSCTDLSLHASTEKLQAFQESWKNRAQFGGFF